MFYIWKVHAIPKDKRICSWIFLFKKYLFYFSHLYLNKCRKEFLFHTFASLQKHKRIWCFISGKWPPLQEAPGAKSWVSLAHFFFSIQWKYQNKFKGNTKIHSIEIQNTFSGNTTIHGNWNEKLSESRILLLFNSMEIHKYSLKEIQNIFQWKWK